MDKETLELILKLNKEHLEYQNAFMNLFVMLHNNDTSFSGKLQPTSDKIANKAFLMVKELIDKNK